MKYKTLLPHTLLQPYVRHYSFTELGTKDEWTSSAIAPTGCSAMFVILEDIIPLLKDRNGNKQPVSAFNVTGQFTSYTPFNFYGQHKAIFIIFNPWGAFRLLGISQANLTDLIVDFFDLLPSKERAIRQQFLDSKKPEETFSLLEALLLRLLLEKKEKNNFTRITSVCRLLMQKAHEPLLLKQVCRNEGFSKSALERNFREFIGLGVKQYHRILRFHSLLTHVKRQKHFRSWTDIAYRFGYYDQAHFIKDFKVFYGKAPSAFSTNDNLISNIIQ